MGIVNRITWAQTKEKHSKHKRLTGGSGRVFVFQPAGARPNRARQNVAGAGSGKVIHSRHSNPKGVSEATKSTHIYT